MKFVLIFAQVMSLLIMCVFPGSDVLSAENIDAMPGKDLQPDVTDHQIAGAVLVDSVRVEGNQRIEQDAIFAVIRTRKGERLDHAKLDKDLRDIYRMGFFKDIRIELEEEQEGTAVVFRVVEKASISKIVFDGNKSMDDAKLKEEVGIKIYSLVDHNEIQQSINRLKEFYRQKGFYNVKIREELEQLPDNEVLLKYKIKEHEKVYITKIQFLGNKEFSDKKLKGLMETSERGFFSWITDSGYLDKKKLEFDVHKLTSFYHYNGFIKARIAAPNVSFDKQEGITITIEVYEGDQYSVNKVSIEGDLIRPVDELLELVQIGKKKIFDGEIVRNDVLMLRNIYADEGYAYAEIRPGTNEDAENFLVDIVYRISKRQKVRLERINITGNTVTRDKVIRRELKVIEGEYYSGEAIRRSEQNLQRLGFFENVEVKTKKGAGKDLMVLDIRIKERPTGSFSFGAGYSAVDSIIGTLQVTQNNLFGRGQKLSASLRLGGRSNQFDIGFTEPWLFDRPFSGNIRAYKWDREFDDYTNKAFGGMLSFGFPIYKIDDFTRGWTKYGYENADISDINPDAAIIIKDMEGKSSTSSITVGMSRNSTNRAWNPTEGSINSFSFEYAGGLLGADNAYNKYTVRSAWFFPLPWSTSAMVQGRLGYLQKRSGGELPVYKKFFLGGIDTVRGFEYDEISPHDPDTGDKIGGEKMMCYNAEYRFPLVKEQGIIGLVFVDAGNVLESDESYTFKGIRMSAGAGVRWYSPMGPLRLEWGYNLDKKRGEPSSNFEFSIGTMF